MGRPLGKRFFGTTVGGASLAGGEGVSSLVVNGANSYSAGTTISFAASPIGGTTAAASITFVTPGAGNPGNGNVASYSITTAGTGYTSAPAITAVIFFSEEPCAIALTLIPLRPKAPNILPLTPG